MEECSPLFPPAAAGAPDRRIRIDMDKDVPFGRFVEVITAPETYARMRDRLLPRAEWFKPVRSLRPAVLAARAAPRAP